MPISVFLNVCCSEYQKHDSKNHYSLLNTIFISGETYKNYCIIQTVICIKPYVRTQIQKIQQLQKPDRNQTIALEFGVALDKVKYFKIKRISEF